MAGLVPPSEEVRVPLTLPPELVTVKVWFPESPGGTVPKLKPVGEMERLAGAGAGGVATGWLGGATCVDFLHFLFEATALLPCFFLHFLAPCAIAEAPPLAGSDRPIVQASSVATNTS